jgi:HAE1 family hydrophobic/amphiphilic exporter-1
MQLIQTSIKRGVTFLMIYLVAVGFGLFSLGRLNVDLFPELNFPIVAVTTQYTGVGPFDIENVVTRPIEESVASVQNIKSVNSTTKQGLSLALLEFEWGTDMDQAEIDVRNALDFITDYLPDDVTNPLVFALDPSMQPIAFLSVGSDVYGLAELRRMSELELEPRIERIPGVALAATSGGLQREIRVLVDPARMRAHHISIQQVEAALQMNNLQIPSGWIENEANEFTIQTKGEYQSIEEIENTNVAVYGSTNIRVKDVADVVDGFKEQRDRVLVNQKPSVLLVVQKQSDANTVNTMRALKKRLPVITRELPKGVDLEFIWDQSDFINRSMANLGNTAFEAILLAFIVLLFFLRNIRSSVIVALSIPISIIVTFAVMDQAGLTLNMISMAGLALAVGLLVDNSIVVLESIFRHREMGKDAAEAAYVGAKEVAMAITASTLTTVSVFVPVLFVPGIAGEIFNDMVVTICFSLGVSLIVALTLVPLLASRFLKIDEAGNGKSWFNRLGDRIGRSIEAMKKRYVMVLDWSLKRRKTILWSTVGIFALSILLLVTRGGEFFPDSDNDYLQMAIDRSPGTSLESMMESVRILERIIEEEIPETEMTYITFGQGTGMMATFSSSASNEGDVMVKLRKRSERGRSMQEVEDAIRDKMNAIPDMKVTFEDRGASTFFGGGGDIQIKIFGHDLNVSEALANDVVSRIKEIRGVATTEVSVKEAAPELVIQLDRKRIADLGLSTAQIGQVISASVLGSVVTRYREGGDEYDVRVQLVKEARESVRDVQNILLMTRTGQQIPLRSVATVAYDKAPVEITREDQERLVSVSISVSGRDLQSTTNEVRRALRDISLPNDYRMEIGGTAEDMMESFMYLGLAFMVAMLLTYAVMASQFESFLSPFIILFTIPLSIIGVSLGLFITGTTLSVMALIGIIMLVGIIVNNGIVLVDYINQLREQGMDCAEAIRTAGEARMRPVIMTALTTILAMLPLALGLGESGENWAPMARSVIGGLLVGTLLTLVIVPVIYASLEVTGRKRKEKRADRLEKRRLKKA